MREAVTALPPEQPPLRVSVVRADERTVVAVAGELDLATAGEFAVGLREALAGGPVVLDISELSFIDSSGLRALDAVLEEVDREGWSLAIRPDLTPAVRQVFELTGMIEPLGIEREPGWESGPG